MNTTAKVIIFPQPTKSGYPLKIRVSSGSQKKYVGLKYYITESQRTKYWNESKKELRKSYPFYDDVQKELQKIVNEYGLDKEEPSIDPFESLTFTQYYKNYMKGLEINHQFGLLQKTRSVFKNLEAYCKESNINTEIQFKDLNVDLLKEFQLFLTKNNVSPISQKGYFEKIRSIINSAITEGKYNPTRHPFLGFEFKKSVIHPKCLSQSQFSVIENKSWFLTGEQRRTAKMFLFQYYTYGMRVSDLMLLKWSNIKEDGTRLRYTMFKTKHEMDINLSPKLLNLLYEFIDEPKFKIPEIEYKHLTEETNPEKFIRRIRSSIRWISTDEATKNKRIFSKHLLEDDSTKAFYIRIQAEASYYNKALKDISKDPVLTSHMARHTFAYLSMLNGDNVYYISQALNHKSVKTTENYLGQFPKRHLDDKFYKKQPSILESKSLDNIIRNFITAADVEKKRKVVEFIKML